MQARIKWLINFYKYKRKLNNYVHKTLVTLAASGEKANRSALKVLFFGTDNFSLPSLKALRTCNAVSNLGVVTSFKSPANCVRTYAEHQQLPLYRWPIETQHCSHYDLGVVVSFGHLIPENIIKAFPLGMINVHASLLPRWRGAAPIIYAIMNGDTKTGVSIMKIEPKRFDIGGILAQQEVPIKEHSFMPELHGELAHEGAKLLLDVIMGYPDSFKNVQHQDDAAATFAPKITPAVTEVIWSKFSARQVFDRFRALYSFKYLHSKFDNKNVQLIDLRLPASSMQASTIHASKPGKFVYQRDRKCLLVHCAGNTFIEVHKLRIEGRKIMSASDFNNGFLKKLSGVDIVFK